MLEYSVTGSEKREVLTIRAWVQFNRAHQRLVHSLKGHRNKMHSKSCYLTTFLLLFNHFFSGISNQKFYLQTA